MTRRILLFDGGCGSCTDVARLVREESRGAIEVINLRSDEAVSLLSGRFPNGWKHRPYYVEIASSTRVYSGAHLSLALLRRCGIVGMLRIVRELARRPKIAQPLGIDRRNFLIKSARFAGALVGAAVGIGAFSEKALAYVPCFLVRCYAQGLYCLYITQCPNRCSIFSVFFCYDAHSGEFCDAVYQDLGIPCPC